MSVHDPESRHVHKTNHNYRDGFKAHIGIEPDTGLITACDLTAGNIGDAQAAPGLLANEEDPVEVLADSGYGAGEFRAHLAEHGHRAIIKPGPLNSAIPGGFTIDDFIIDLDAMTATCPNEIMLAISPRTRQARFRRRCEGCPIRQRCPRAAAGQRPSRPRPSRTTRRGTRARPHRRVNPALPPTPANGRTIHCLADPTAADAKSATTASPATASGSPTDVAAINLRRLITLGLDWDNGWQLAT